MKAKKLSAPWKKITDNIFACQLAGNCSEIDKDIQKINLRKYFWPMVSLLQRNDDWVVIFIDKKILTTITTRASSQIK